MQSIARTPKLKRYSSSHPSCQYEHSARHRAVSRYIVDITLSSRWAENTHWLPALQSNRPQHRRAAEQRTQIGAALWTNPNAPEALSSHGAVVAKHKCAEEAAASCEKAVAIKPDYAHAFTNRGGGSVRECAASRLCKLISGQCVTTCRA